MPSASYRNTIQKLQDAFVRNLFGFLTPTCALISTTIGGIVGKQCVSCCLLIRFVEQTAFERDQENKAKAIKKERVYTADLVEALKAEEKVRYHGCTSAGLLNADVCCAAVAKGAG